MTENAPSVLRVQRWLGWRLMSLPWLTHRTFKRGMRRMNWHARLYRLGARWANK